MSLHQNNGQCEYCVKLKNKFPNMNQALWSWFQLFQAKHHEFHISEAGRGYEDQERDFKARATKAHFGQSAHNYNCAIDTFIILPGRDMYDPRWYSEVLAPEIPDYLEWYGKPGSAFFELPHIELKTWKLQRDNRMIALVEKPRSDIA